MAFQSGKNAKVRFGVGATTLKVKKWVITPKNPELDVTNTESGAVGEYLGSISDWDVEIECDVDVGSSVFAAFVPGSFTSTVKLYENDTTGVFWSIASLLVKETPVTAEVRGLVSMRIVGIASGGVTPPTT